MMASSMSRWVNRGIARPQTALTMAEVVAIAKARR
jgi:hypothetical protein